MSSIGSTSTTSILGSSPLLSASLTFEAFLAEQQDLAIKTATSGLQGLLDSLNQTGVYQSLVSSFSQSVEAFGMANEAAAANPFQAASSAQGSAHKNATEAAYSGKINAFQSGVNSAQSQSATAQGHTQAGTDERTAGNAVLAAANKLVATWNAMKSQPPDVSQVNATVTQAQNARDAAYTAWNALSAGDQATRKAQALAVLNAAENVLTQAMSLNALADSSLTKIQGKTPSFHDLGDGYTLASWGNSGVLTLYGPDGKGILINHDGTVDNLDGSGNGWKFNSSSTFVLPNETKITITPGTPASVLVTRGEHHFNITNLRSGQNANTSAYASEGGRAADQARNDGHIFSMTGTATNGWETSGGNVLGDLPSSREQVGTSPVTNELKLDASDIELTEEQQQMVAYLASIGYTVPDYDGDGKYNNEELFAASQVLQEIVAGLQAEFAQSLTRIAQANAVLMELTMFLETIRAQGDKRQGDKDALSAEEQATLADIERRLVAAFNALKGENANAATPDPSVPTGAEYVLQQLTQFNQQGFAPPPNFTGAPPPATPQTGSPNSEALDSLGQALQRASRLLSGFSNLNFLEMPPAGTTPPGTEETTETLPGASEAAPPITGELPPEIAEMAQALRDLQQALIQQGIIDGTVSTGQLPPLPEIAAGLQAFFNALAANPEVVALGLPPTQDGQYFAGVFSQLSLSTLSQQELRDLAPGLLGLVGAFAELAAFQDEDLPPEVTGQPAPASPGSLAPETRFAEQLRLVLQGLATLSTPGFQQSVPGQSLESSPLHGTATPEQIRAGLERFLGALVTLGLVPPPPETSLGNVLGGLEDNREQIQTITSNFYTDPELMKRLQENLNQTLKIHAEQLNQASNLFIQAQETVQNFVQLIKNDDLVKEIVTSDDLSDEEQDKFADKMKDLQKEWGIEWGGPPSTSAEESQLVAKVMQSGMMV